MPFSDLACQSGSGGTGSSGTSSAAFVGTPLTAVCGILDRVRFHGHVEDIARLCAPRQMLVIPSRGEGTPLALVEAQICGRPAVVTNVGGNVEWVEEGVTGFVADRPCASVVGAALDRAWQRRADWEAMGRRAHEAAMNKIDQHPGKTLLSAVLTTANEA